jgi:nucleotide-binding universal stress UspA family protein
MLTLAKILLPVDLSDRCAGEARYVVPLAKHFNSEITVLHVLSPQAAYHELEVGKTPDDTPGGRHERAKADLEAFLGTELRNLPVARVLEAGDPATRIVEYARAGNIGLIMMPTHGYGPFRRLLLGSVTAKVLHDADCPVWTGVHTESGPPTEPARLNHVACAVDLGPQSALVLDWASRIAAEFKARLSLVHVIASLDPRTETYYFSPEWHEQMIECAKADIETLQTGLGTSAEIHLEVGDVHKAVCSAVQALQADLLVTGRSAASGSSGRLPSCAYAIIRDSPCPVVSV